MSFRYGMDVIVYFDGFGQINWSRPGYSSSDARFLDVGCPVTLKSELERK
jgi:hypothetical protein